MDWARSIDRLIDLKPEILVPCHTRPVHGRTRIREQLTHYRDAIHLFTIRP